MDIKKRNDSTGFSRPAPGAAGGKKPAKASKADVLGDKDTDGRQQEAEHDAMQEHGQEHDHRDAFDQGVKRTQSLPLATSHRSRLSPNKTNVGFSSLPPELKEVVLDNIKDKRDFVALATTSKQLLHLAQTSPALFPARLRFRQALDDWKQTYRPTTKGADRYQAGQEGCKKIAELLENNASVFRAMEQSTQLPNDLSKAQLERISDSATYAQYKPVMLFDAHKDECVANLPPNIRLGLLVQSDEPLNPSAYQALGRRVDDLHLHQIYPESLESQELTAIAQSRPQRLWLKDCRIANSPKLWPKLPLSQTVAVSARWAASSTVDREAASLAAWIPQSATRICFEFHDPEHRGDLAFLRQLATRKNLKELVFPVPLQQLSRLATATLPPNVRSICLVLPPQERSDDFARAQADETQKSLAAFQARFFKVDIFVADEFPDGPPF